MDREQIREQVTESKARLIVYKCKRCGNFTNHLVYYGKVKYLVTCGECYEYRFFEKKKR